MRGGFTFIELMIVVTIIAVTAALAAPTIASSMAERRATEAALDIVRLARKARSESIAYGRAHLLRFQSQDRGQIEVYRGINSGCNTNNWPTILAQGTCDDVGSLCADRIRMASGDYDGGGGLATLATPGRGFIELCYEPTGVMRWRTAVTERFTDRSIDLNGTNLGGGVQFSVTRYKGGDTLGVPRWAVLPLSADPRVRR